MADPLALFAGDSDSDSDSSDNEDDLAAKNAQKTAEKKPQTKPANALPDPLSLLASTGRPSFLDRPHERGIDWERRTVKAPEPPPDEECVPYSYRAKGSAALPAVSSHTTTESYEPAPPAEDPTSEGDCIQKEMKAWNSLYQYEPESLVRIDSDIHLSLSHSFHSSSLSTPHQRETESRKRCEPGTPCTSTNWSH
ncbi:UPF0690 protein C1orf52 homolog A-like isoform X2 [Branchiostoma floridae x Branchiostoma japonicum]